VLVFMGVGGILMGLLSYRIYKTALFYISMLLTAYIVLKSFLITLGSGIGLTAFVLVLIGKTQIGGVADSIISLPVGNNGTVSTAVADVLAKLPGSTQSEKFWIVVVAALIAGAVVGGIVCVLQRPAIIVVTASFGGLLISQGVISFIASFQTFDASAQSIVNSFSGGNGQPALSTIVAAAFIILGIIVQFKTSQKT